MTLDANLWIAVLSGLIGAIAMIVFFYALSIVGIRFDIPYFIGSNFVPPEQKGKAYLYGFLIFLGIGMLWGFLYVTLMNGLSQPPSMPFSLVFGFGNGIFAGVLLSTFADSHPYVGEGKTFKDPGMFGARWNFFMPYLIVVGHLIYAVVMMYAYLHIYQPVYVPRV